MNYYVLKIDENKTNYWIKSNHPLHINNNNYRDTLHWAGDRGRARVLNV